jgi:hypothetical protein
VQAFRGYTGDALAREFAEKPDSLGEAAAAEGGVEMAGVGDRAWMFTGLPNVPVTLVWWNGDDEFPPRADLMFDETAPHHLTTDGCAVLGSWLTSMLLAARTDDAPREKGDQCRTPIRNTSGSRSSRTCTAEARVSTSTSSSGSFVRSTTPSPTS